MSLSSRRSQLPAPGHALPGRTTAMPVHGTHLVLGGSTVPPWPAGTEVLYIAMGCFWGAERIFWRLPGVVSTAAGYLGGATPNPTYQEVCSGQTGHTEGVLVAYDPAKTSPQELLKAFWENHDPTQGYRQGNDIGSQYRSAIYWTTPGQQEAALATRDAFGQVLREHGHGAITTELAPYEQAGPFYYAEDYHQQYLHKNPGGYCNHGPNGCSLDVRQRTLEQLQRSE